MGHCLRSRHYVNVVIAGKHPAPQWLTMDAAVKHCSEGNGFWPWASNDQGVAVDVVSARHISGPVSCSRFAARYYWS
jgi:xylulose-5-phosphate/fructose-6-phosphate phosphoketolase